MRHSPERTSSDDPMVYEERISFARRIARLVGDLTVETAGVTGIAINAGVRATGALARGIFTGS